MPRSASRGKKYRPPQAAARERAVAPDEALRIAIERHRAGHLDEAEPVYAALLERLPEHPDVLGHFGILHHQRGRHQEALALLERAVAAAPQAAGAWNNLGNVLFELDRTEDAERAFERSLAIEPNPQAWSNLSRVWRRRTDWARGEEACRRALALAPEFGEAWHNLSLALLSQGRAHEGFQAAMKATLLLPAHARRRDFYARALLLSGEKEKAAALYRTWLAEEPDNPVVRHHLATCTGEPPPERASDAYVEQVFDRFAESFDDKLAALQYRAPELVAEALSAVLPAPAQQFDVADLGCGTGLCGPLLRGWARRLEGVDLSQAMLEQAAARGVYDVLEKAELVHYLQARPEAFDVLACADTLCYFGELHGALAAAARALRPGGRIAFTVEAAADDEATYLLDASGRYAHGLAYVRRVLAASGLALRAAVGDMLRTEGGAPVRGWVVSAARAD